MFNHCFRKSEFYDKTNSYNLQVSSKKMFCDNNNDNPY